MKKLLSFFSLFTSVGTLICCAIPALLVLIGAGASVAGLVSTFPGLVWLSMHKGWIFGLGAIFITFGFLAHYLLKDQACPEGEMEEVCAINKQRAPILLIISSALYAIGFFVSFILPKII